MKKTPIVLWIAAAGFALADLNVPALAKDLDAPLAAPEQEKNAGSDLTIDSWQPKALPRPPDPEPEPAKPAVTPNNAGAPASKKASAPAAATEPVKNNVAEKSAPASAPAAPAAPAAPRVAMNEMAGTLASLDVEEHTFRISVDGGFTPQFAYDKETVVVTSGPALKVADLKHGERLVVRYIGRDMTAREIALKPSKP